MAGLTKRRCTCGHRGTAKVSLQRSLEKVIGLYTTGVPRRSYVRNKLMLHAKVSDVAWRMSQRLMVGLIFLLAILTLC